MNKNSRSVAFLFLIFIVISLTDCNESDTIKGNAFRWDAMIGTDSFPGISLAITKEDYFIVDSASGIYYSKDYGSHWSKGNGPSDYIYTFAMDSSSNLLAGGYTNLLRSTDHGENWNIFPSFGSVGSNISSVEVKKNGNYFVSRSRDGIYRSSNQGATWDTLNSASYTGLITSMIFNSTGDIFTSSGRFGQGIFKSTDNGNSWLKVNGSSPWPIVIDSKDNIYGVGKSYFLKSADKGVTWDLKNYIFDPDSSSSSGLYSMAVDNRDRIFVGCGGPGVVLMSDDGGASWQPVGIGLSSGHDIYKIAFDSKGFIYLRTSERIYKSSIALSDIE